MFCTHREKSQILLANYQVINRPKQLRKSYLYVIESGKKRLLLQSYNKKQYFVKYTSYIYQPNIKYDFFLEKQIIKEKQVYSMRSILYDKIISNLYLAQVPYLLPILLGIKEGDFTLFKKTGTWHLLCVGGLHLHFLQGIILFISRCFYGANPHGIYPLFHILELLFLWLFVYLSGCQVPALRSVIMLSIDIIGRMLHFSISIELRYYITFLLLLIYNTDYVFDLGFQMSFLAVYMIISFSRYFKRSSWLKNSLIINSLISLGVLLYSMLLHGNINLLSPILNLVTIPIFFLCLSLIGFLFLFPYGSFIGIYLFKLLEWILFYGDRYGIFIYYKIKKSIFIYYLIPYIGIIMLCKYIVMYISMNKQHNTILLNNDKEK